LMTTASKKPETPAFMLRSIFQTSMFTGVSQYKEIGQ